MKSIVIALRLQLPFLVAGFVSFLFSVWLYFIAHQKQAGIFVGLWVPSIHSLGTLLLTTVRRPELASPEVALRSDSDRVGS
jgi:hypothetical protein